MTSIFHVSYMWGTHTSWVQCFKVPRKSFKSSLCFKNKSSLFCLYKKLRFLKLLSAASWVEIVKFQVGGRSRWNETFRLKSCENRLMWLPASCRSPAILKHLPHCHDHSVRKFVTKASAVLCDFPLSKQRATGEASELETAELLLGFHCFTLCTRVFSNNLLMNECEKPCSHCVGDLRGSHQSV